MKNSQQFLSGTFVPGRIALLLIIIGCMLASACTRKLDVPGVASLNVFNGIVGATNLASDLSEASPIHWYKTSNLLTYGNTGIGNPLTSRSNIQFNSYNGTQRIKFYNYPDTLPHSKPVLDLSLELPAGTINSLYLTGTVDAPDSLFVRDHLPYYSPTDSVTGIRVVNLVPGLTASVNLKGNPDGSEWTSLGYKSVSAFKSYPVVGSGTNYVFEVRDAATGDLVVTSNVDTRDRRQSTSFINYYRFKNITLAIYGGLGNTGATAPKVAIISNY